MTITAPEPTQTGSAPAAPEPDEAGTIFRSVGELRYLDPRTLVVDPYNHRKNREGKPVTPDAKLIASVEAVGVDTPITVRPQADGTTLGAVKGQRRLMAAVIAAEKAAKAKRPVVLIPVLVREDLAGVDDEALVLSMIENTHREAASQRDDMDALTQLALMPMTATKRKKHARALGYTTAQVEAANTAAKLDDDALAEALDAEFDFIEMADWQSVGGDDGDLWELKQARKRDRAEGKKGRGHWNHAIARLRQELAEEARREQLVKELTDAGVRITERQYTWSRTTERPLSDLLNALGKEMTPQRHAEMCAAHGAYVERDNETVVYVCTDWAKQGHQLTEAVAKAESGRNGGREVLDSAAKAKRTRRYKPLWLAAREVRKDFITELVARKDASKAVWDAVLSTTVATPHWYTDGLAKHATEDLSRFLKMKDPKLSAYRYQERTKAYASLVARTSAARRGNVLFAQLAACAELVVMHERAWDQPSEEVAWWLQLLVAEGYTLSEVEAEVLATATGTAAPQTQAEAEDDGQEPLAERNAADQESTEDAGQQDDRDGTGEADADKPSPDDAPQPEEQADQADPDDTEQLGTPVPAEGEPATGIEVEAERG
ncbi:MULTISPECIES: ParB N-terminal domain-containing protein [Streptacidiphilus]|uniref:ParB N-terminal domain-containing protein n=1 Tax=Streptacidiphilus cavernicola TaxID=3342716 RepID=A0ABV6UWG2_9ACTN|nr:ParB N-terminal domain-containing protein [Streptacidiphilus jeojiense]